MNEITSWCSEKINKIEKPLARPKKKEKMQITKIGTESGTLHR